MRPRFFGTGGEAVTRLIMTAIFTFALVAGWGAFTLADSNPLTWANQNEAFDLAVASLDGQELDEGITLEALVETTFAVTWERSSVGTPAYHHSLDIVQMDGGIRADLRHPRCVMFFDDGGVVIHFDCEDPAGGAATGEVATAVRERLSR